MEETVLERLTVLPSNLIEVENAWNTTSWLDHCLTTDMGHSKIRNKEILHSYMSSDHKPMLIDLSIDQIMRKDEDGQHVSPYINWNELRPGLIESIK